MADFYWERFFKLTNITLYSLDPSVCRDCWSTELRMRRHGIEAKKVRIDEDAEAQEYVKRLGYSSAPVVVVEKDGEIIDHWGRFREDKIAGLKDIVGEAVA